MCVPACALAGNNYTATTNAYRAYHAVPPLTANLEILAAAAQGMSTEIANACPTTPQAVAALPSPPPIQALPGCKCDYCGEIVVYCEQV